MRIQRRTVLVCCCISTACGGAAKLAGTKGPSFTQTVSLTANGVALDLSAQASLSLLNPPSYAQIVGEDAVLLPPHTVQVVLGAYPLSAGSTQTCGMNGVGIGYSDNGKSFLSGVNAALPAGSPPTSCTITITAYNGSGQPMEGTFSGTLDWTGGGGSTVIITNGRFKVAAH